MTDQIKEAIEALEYADKRHEKIRNALDFIRYGGPAKILTVDGQALADAGNNLSVARHELNEALTIIRKAQETHVLVPMKATREMLVAGAKEIYSSGNQHASTQRAWKSMIAAATSEQDKGDAS